MCPLLSKQVWAIRARLVLAGNLRELALFNVAIDSKLRGFDLVSRKITDMIRDDRARERMLVVQRKTNKPVQFELGDNTRETVTNWTKSPEMIGCGFMYPSRFHDRPHISTRRTKLAEIYGKTGNLRAVQLLLGHTKVDRNVRYLGVELEGAVSIAERIDIKILAIGLSRSSFRSCFRRSLLPMRKGPLSATNGSLTRSRSKLMFNINMIHSLWPRQK